MKTRSIAKKSRNVLRIAPIVCGVMLLAGPTGAMAADECTFTWDGNAPLKISVKKDATAEEQQACVNALLGDGTSTGWNLTTTTGETTTGPSTIMPNDTVNLTAGTNMEITQTTSTDGKTTTVTIGTKKDLVADSLTITNGPILNGDGINMNGDKITNLADGVNDSDAVNLGQLKDYTDGLIEKGMDFAGNAGDDVHRDLGQTLTIKGEATTAGTYSGANLKTVTDPRTGTINLQMADSPKFGEVTINDGGSGKITGVAPGEVSPTSKEAINGSQLYQTNQAINNLNQRYDTLDKEARAGTASAMAAAGLPQAYLPGKSMVAMSGATYRGATGFALGVSTITDNGKWVLKGSVNSNNKGHVGATVGAGYQW